MTEDLARGIARAAEILQRQSLPQMVATVSLVALPPNLIRGGGTRGMLGEDGLPVPQFCFAVRGAEPGQPERTFLHVEEAISYLGSRGFRRLLGAEEDEWRSLIVGLNRMTGRDVGEPLLIFGREVRQENSEGMG